jgi:DNA polymerase-3 subunit delta
MQAFFTLLSKIEKNQFSPFYLLSGEESYYIDSVVAALSSKLVNEASRDFDYTVLFGKETNASEIIETAKRYPMLSKYNFIVVKEAQQLQADVFENLAVYAAQPTAHTIVVLCFMHKAFDKRKKLYKAIEKTGEVLTVKPLFENQVPQWIKNHATALGLTLTPTAIQLLSSYTGTNLSRLSKELDKLKVVAQPNETLDVDAIEKYVGISKEFNSFELQKAIGLGNFSLAFQIVQYLNRNPKANPLVLVLASLHSYFQKLLLLKGIENPQKGAALIGVPPFFMREYEAAAKRFTMKQISAAMSCIFEADLKSKGVHSSNSNSEEILETLLLKLFTL